MNRQLTNEMSFHQVSYGTEAIKALNNSVSPTEARLSYVNSCGTIDFKDLISKSRVYYVVDGLYRKSIDSIIEQYTNIKLKGKEEIVKKLQKRLTTMALRTGEPWEVTTARALDEFIKCGNSFVQKIRGNNKLEDKDGTRRRPFYTNSPYEIAALELISPDALEYYSDAETSSKGWKYRDKVISAEISKELPGSVKRDKTKAKRALPRLPKDVKKVFINDLDILHLYYKKPAGEVYGLGVGFGGVEDIKLLRGLESVSAQTAKRNSSPFIHHVVNAGQVGIRNKYKEISDIEKRYAKSSGGGVIVTGPGHEIKVFGAENHAMRLEGLISAFSARASVGVGSNPVVLGLHPATLSTAQAAKSQLMDKVRFMQSDFKRLWQWGILWEILWEEGYDPYENEDERVYLEFEETDEDRKRAIDTHWADMFTKNLVDQDYALKKMGVDEPQNPAKLQVNLVQIPVKKAGPDRPAGTPTRKEFINQSAPYVPSEEGDIEDSILLICRKQGIKLDPLLNEKFCLLHNELSSLIKDEEAYLTLVYSVLYEKG